MLFAFGLVLSFDESVQAPIDGGEELHSFWVQATWVSYKHWVFGKKYSQGQECRFGVVSCIPRFPLAWGKGYRRGNQLFLRIIIYT